jgi:lipopolysaccharide/colanic/teichoic acid biosynthesis glycosyltransferase
MNLIIKRLSDIILSVFALLLLFPVLFIVSISIKIDSKGPILFKQKRLTKNGKVFEILKFRSMVLNAEKMGSGLYNFKNDTRVTKVGNFLRRTSLDELPQLINVLKGDMAIVGPRPSVLNEIGEYSELNSKYKKRYQMKAGITGLAQISGRNDLPWSIKIDYDNKYIDQFERFGIFIDIKIILLTFISIFKTKNIYEEKNIEHVGLSDEEIAKLETEKIIAEATRKDG